MPKYIFSHGTITVEDSVYVPILRDDKRARRSVLIIVRQLAQTDELEETTQDETQAHVSRQRSADDSPNGR